MSISSDEYLWWFHFGHVNAGPQMVYVFFCKDQGPKTPLEDIFFCKDQGPKTPLEDIVFFGLSFSSFPSRL